MIKTTLLFIALGVLFASCSKLSVDIAKRKYRPGFFVNISNDNKKNVVTTQQTDEGKKNTSDTSYSTDFALQPEPETVCETISAGQNAESNTSLPATAAPQQQQPPVKQKTTTAETSANKQELEFIPAPDIAKEKNTRSGDKMFLLFSALTGALAIGLLHRRKNTAVKLSYWAKNNKWKSRFAIGITHVALAVAAVFAGKQLHENNYHISPLARNTMAVACVTAALLYPRKNSTSYSYLRHKTADIALILSGTMLLASTSNQLHADRSSSIAKLVTAFTEKFSPAPLDAGTGYAQYNDNETTTPSFSESHHHENSVGAKIMLTIFALIGFALLLFIVASLSCSLSCSGNEAAGAVVGIIGVIGAILLLVLALNAIFSTKPDKHPQ